MVIIIIIIIIKYRLVNDRYTAHDYVVRSWLDLPNRVIS